MMKLRPFESHRINVKLRMTFLCAQVVAHRSFGISMWHSNKLKRMFALHLSRVRSVQPIAWPPHHDRAKNEKPVHNSTQGFDSWECRMTWIHRRAQRRKIRPERRHPKRMRKWKKFHPRNWSPRHDRWPMNRNYSKRQQRSRKLRRQKRRKKQNA